MAWLRVYEWERDAWPEFQKQMVERDEQLVLLKKLSRHFKVDMPRLVFSHQRGSNASQSVSGAAGKYLKSAWDGECVIKLGKITMLGTLVHEFAHHLNWRRNVEDGHGRKFKRELKRTYTWAKRYLEIPKEDSLTTLH